MPSLSRASAALAVFCASVLIGCSKSEPVPNPADAAAPNGTVAGDAGATLGAATPAGVSGATQVTAPDATQAGPTRSPTSGLVKGTIRDSSGAPVASAAVAVVAGTGPYPEMAAFTAADGSFQWILGPGTYTLEAYRDGFAPATGEVTVEAGQQVELDLTLTPE